jgi:uncharacterized damage-inducible protein DinB
MNLYEPSTRDENDADSGGWTRARVISALATARAGLLEAVTGLTPREAEKAMSPGKWNVRETVLHLVARDRARLAEMEATLAGTEASWRAHSPEDYARLNAEELAPLRTHSWDQALALLDSTRRDLQERLAAVPEEPTDPWQPAHPFGWMMEGLHQHDRHHAQLIRRWRAANGI